MNTLLRAVIVLFGLATFSYAAPFPLSLPAGEIEMCSAYEMDDMYLFAGDAGATVGDQSSQGEVHVFKRTGGNTWAYQTTLHAPDGTSNDNFGRSLAYNGSGTLIVGAPVAPWTGRSRGAIYKFNLDSGTGTWAHVATYGNDSCSSLARFGTSVDVFQDRIIVGAPSHYAAGYIGMVCIMDISNGDIIRTITGSVNSGSWGASTLGYSVSINGTYAVASARGDTNPASNDGRVYVFDKNISDGDADSWGLKQYIANPDTSSEYCEFGATLALSHTTEDLLVADSVESSIAEYAGVTHRYSLNPINSTWELRETYRGNSQAHQYFGSSVGIYGDRFLIGASGYYDDPSEPVGAVFRYKKNVDWVYEGIMRDEEYGTVKSKLGSVLDISENYYVINSIVHKKGEYVPPVVVSPGDVNNDSILNLTDVVLSLQIAAGIIPSDTVYAGADINGDKKIGMVDALFVLRAVAGL
ncbi:MAG: hypothetical protein JEZ02_18330 [Desulfatibacillum sp.]|nr:hypothetical protein [Desulfatibacillum sp.]